MSSPIAALYVISTLITNIRACMNGGNQVSGKFGLSPPSLYKVSLKTGTASASTHFTTRSARSFGESPTPFPIDPPCSVTFVPAPPLPGFVAQLPTFRLSPAAHLGLWQLDHSSPQQSSSFISCTSSLTAPSTGSPGFANFSSTAVILSQIFFLSPRLASSLCFFCLPPRNIFIICLNSARASLSHQTLAARLVPPDIRKSMFC